MRMAPSARQRFRRSLRALWRTSSGPSCARCLSSASAWGRRARIGSAQYSNCRGAKLPGQAITALVLVLTGPNPGQPAIVGRQTRAIEVTIDDRPHFIRRLPSVSL